MTRFGYRFDNLSVMDRLEIAAQSPLLSELGRTLPRQGVTTRPAKTSPAGMLLLGIASVIAGSDRRAEAELRTHWHRFRRVCRASDITMPAEPLGLQVFRDYRVRLITEEVLADLHLAFRAQAVQLAQLLGLLKNDDSSLSSPATSQVVFGDGSWFLPASDVGRVKTDYFRRNRPHQSRAEKKPRVVDYDVQGAAYGYNHVTLHVRAATKEEDPAAARLQVVLALVAAKGSDEMHAADLAVKQLRDAVGDGFRCFVYDGAMAGEHHRRFRSYGLLTINKPKGISTLTDWRNGLDTHVGGGKRVLELAFPAGCVHRLNVAYGMFWQLEPNPTGRRLLRQRVADHVDLRRHHESDGFRWELDVALRCDRHHTSHVFTIDPNSQLSSSTRLPGGVGLKLLTVRGNDLVPARGTVNLAEQLRIVQPNCNPAMQHLYGLRNNSEAHHHLIKDNLSMGNRARSFARHHHELDRLLAVLLLNVLVLAEHGPAELRPKSWGDMAAAS